MPFELGLAVQLSKIQEHDWFVFEAKSHRIKKSLSDLNGIDVLIHGGQPRGVLSQIANAFVRIDSSPTLPQMLSVYKDLKAIAGALIKHVPSRSIFERQVFKQLTLAGSYYAIVHVEQLRARASQPNRSIAASQSH
jgi:hypothetical protein